MRAPIVWKGLEFRIAKSEEGHYKMSVGRVRLVYLSVYAANTQYSARGLHAALHWAYATVQHSQIYLR